MRLPLSLRSLVPFVALAATSCFTDVPDDGAGETVGDGDSTGEGDGDGDPSGDGDGDPSGDGDGDSGDGDGDTGPMCSPEETECGGECANLDESPNHCGACDHDCLGGSCNVGTCEPVLLANGKGRLFMVHVDQDHVYYGGDGVDVGRIDKDGSNDTNLVPAGEFCYDSAITGNAVVWGNDWNQPGVRGCILPDCAGGVQIFKPGMHLYGMSFDAMNGKLYWNQGDNIVAAMWPAGMITNFVATVGPFEMDTDGDYVYWVSRLALADYHIRKRPVGGGNVVELAINRPSAGAIAAAPGKIIWADMGAIVEAALPNGIGGADPAVFASVGGVRKIVIDDTHVYWTSNQDNVGTVGRCPIAGCDGPPEIMAQVPQPWGITFDPAAIYVVTEAGVVFKVAK